MRGATWKNKPGKVEAEARVIAYTSGAADVQVGFDQEAMSRMSLDVLRRMKEQTERLDRWLFRQIQKLEEEFHADGNC